MRVSLKNYYKVLQVLAVSNVLSFSTNAKTYAVMVRKQDVNFPHVISYVSDMLHDTWYEVTSAEYYNLKMISDIFGSTEGVYDPTKPETTARLRKDRIFKDISWQNAQLGRKTDTQREQSQEELDAEEAHEAYREEVLRRDAKERE